MRRALLVFLVWVGVAGTAAAQPTPAEAAAADNASDFVSAEEMLPRLGVALALDGARPLGEHVYAAALGFSAAALFVFNEPLGLAELGVTTWPGALRAERSPQDFAHPRRHWEFFVRASIYPFDLAPLHFGFYLALTLASIAARQADRAALGPSVLWSISERCGLRYQLGLTAGTNLLQTALVSSLAFDVVLF
jgi:hypothetical protein